jgi:hypothetical protein
METGSYLRGRDRVRDSGIVRGRRSSRGRGAMHRGAHRADAVARRAVRVRTLATAELGIGLGGHVGLKDVRTRDRLVVMVMMLVVMVLVLIVMVLVTVKMVLLMVVMVLVIIVVVLMITMMMFVSMGMRVCMFVGVRRVLMMVLLVALNVSMRVTVRMLVLVLAVSMLVHARRRGGRARLGRRETRANAALNGGGGAGKLLGAIVGRGNRIRLEQHGAVLMLLLGRFGVEHVVVHVDWRVDDPKENTAGKTK